MSSELILFAKVADDGRQIEVVPLTFGRARITIGSNWSPFLDDGW